MKNPNGLKTIRSNNLFAYMLRFLNSNKFVN